MEVLTLSWSNTATVLQNYLDYPRVFLALVDMMHEQKINPEVYELLLQMFKSIISKLVNQIMFLFSKINSRHRRQEGPSLPLQAWSEYYWWWCPDGRDISIWKTNCIESSHNLYKWDCQQPECVLLKQLEPAEENVDYENIKVKEKNACRSATQTIGPWNQESNHQGLDIRDEWGLLLPPLWRLTQPK